MRGAFLRAVVAGLPPCVLRMCVCVYVFVCMFLGVFVASALSCQGVCVCVCVCVCDWCEVSVCVCEVCVFSPSYLNCPFTGKHDFFKCVWICVHAQYFDERARGMRAFSFKCAFLCALANASLCVTCYVFFVRVCFLFVCVCVETHILSLTHTHPCGECVCV